MSLRQLFRLAWPRIMREKWGTRIMQPDGSSKDTGVQPFAEEIAALLASEEPLTLDGPIIIERTGDHPIFEVRNAMDDAPFSPVIFQNGPPGPDGEQGNTGDAGATGETNLVRINTIGELYIAVSDAEDGMISVAPVDSLGEVQGATVTVRTLPA